MTSINGVNLVVPCINAKEIRLIKASQNSGSILEWRINLSHIFLHQKFSSEDVFFFAFILVTVLDFALLSELQNIP